LIKIVKTDTDALTVFVFNEKEKFDKVIVYQQDKDSAWKVLKEFKALENEVAYTVKGIKHFFKEIDESTFKVDLLLGDAIVGTLTSPTMNTITVPWKRGIIKVKKQEFLIKAKNINGNKLLVFKKLNDRVHCPDCWDKDLRTSNNTNCPTCGGTGYIDKYSEPFFTWGGPYMTQPVTPPLGNIEGKDRYNPNLGAMASISLLPDIPMNELDLVYIVEARELNIVKSITQTSFNNMLISQNVSVASLPVSSREYQSVNDMLMEKIKELNGVR
jgi:hypothetical protein